MEQQICKFKIILLTIICFFNTYFSFGKMIKLETEHIIARYDSEAEEYVLASIKILEELRELAIKSGFDLPDKIKFEIIRTDRNVIWVSKKTCEKITWEYTSLDNFLPPQESKKKNIYGLCHEIGHLCMYRTFFNNNLYLSYNYRESWADFFGNTMIDSIFNNLGIDFWPEPHNYTEFSGMDFLFKQIANNKPDLSDFNICSQFWIELSNQIGFSNFNNFFTDITNQMKKTKNVKQGFLVVLENYTNKTEIKDWYSEYVDYIISKDE